MLEALIMILPGVFMTAIYDKTSVNNKGKRYQFLLRILVACVVSNLTARVLLWIMGNRNFRLAEMGIGFKFKYCLVEVFILCVLLAVYKIINKQSRKESIDYIKQTIPMSLFLMITYGIFMPSSLFLGNIKEFPIGYTAILPIIMMMTVLMAVSILIFVILFGNKITIHYIAAFLFSIAFGLYVQGNFLNPNLPQLDGTKIDWTNYAVAGRISVSFWILCMIGCQIAVRFWRKKAQVAFQYISVFLSLVQAITLAVLLVTAGENGAPDVVLTRDDEYTIGTDKNIIVFVLDAMESEDFENIIANDEKFHDELQNFTYFNNAVSGGTNTAAAMPLLLTGIEYDPTWLSYEDYLQEAWDETEVYQDLKKGNFDVRIFTENQYIGSIQDGMINNAKLIEGDYYISSPYEFTIALYRFASFYMAPQPLKQYFWFYSDDMVDLIKVDAREYYFDDIQFYDNLLKEGKLETKYQNSMRLYHLFGAHSPYTMNENVEPVPREEGTLIQQMQGSMKIVFSYIEKMRESGIYDASMIIITADHGKQGKKNSIGQNPAFLVKMPYAAHDFETNDAPIHFRNVVATIESCVLQDYSAYGPTIFDVDETSDVERMHTVNAGRLKEDFPDIPCVNGHARFIIPEDARNMEEVSLYDPYEINNVTYTMGEVIDFTTENVYADNIAYRLYKEDHVGIASNELNICFVLQDYHSGDIELHFTYADVYNDSQRIKVYAKGQKIADITAAPENGGAENIVIIPEECIEDGILPIRMLFPNAVTPHQIDSANQDMRILSVAFESIILQQQ